MTLSTSDQIEYNLYRILQGYYYIDIDDVKYKVVYPSTAIKYEAQELYLQIIEDNKYDTSWLSDFKISMILNQNGIWGKDKDELLKNQEQGLEIEKIALYQNYTNTDRRKAHKKTIAQISKTIEQLTLDKNSLNYLTLPFFAETIKYEYIIMHCVYEKTMNTRLFNKNTINTTGYKKIQDITKVILSKQFTTTDLRAIAKSDLWQSYYNEDSTFSGSSIDQNDDQRHLLRLSKMYDSVKQHPEPPSDDIIQDDDALDGWFLFQKNKANKEKDEKNIMDRVGGSKKMQEAGEVFVMSNDRSESQRINSLNDPKTAQDKQKAYLEAKAKGQVSFKDLDHVIQNKLHEDGKAGYEKIRTQRVKRRK